MIHLTLTEDEWITLRLALRDRMVGTWDCERNCANPWECEYWIHQRKLASDLLHRIETP